MSPQALTAVDQLGAGGPLVSPIGLGCAGMSGLYGPRDETQSIATVHRAIARGVNLFDTADFYGAGHNEELLGRATRHARDKVLLATKFGATTDPEGRRVLGVDASPQHVIQACDASLRRLGTDYIDLFYLQRMDPTVPIEETVGAMANLVTDGKVRSLGICEAPPDLLRRACKVHAIAALQSEFSLWWRRPEEELLPLCAELGVTYVAYSPLGRGLLAGAITDADDLSAGDNRSRHPRFLGDNLHHNLQLVERLRDLSARKGCTVAQLALAWLLQIADHVVPIIGTTRRAHLDENLEAAHLTLTHAELKLIDDAAPHGAGAGARYHAEGSRFIPGA